MGPLELNTKRWRVDGANGSQPSLTKTTHSGKRTRRFKPESPSVSCSVQSSLSLKTQQKRWLPYQYAFKQNRTSWLAALLAGELLHREEAWQLSNQYLHSAVKQLEKLAVSDETASPMPLTQQQYKDLALEGRRLIGINAYHQQDYETANRRILYDCQK